MSIFQSFDNLDEDEDKFWQTSSKVYKDEFNSNFI